MFVGFSLQDFMLISKPVFVDILDASLFNLGSILNPKIDLGGAPAGKRRHCKTFVFLKEHHTLGAWRAPRDYQNRPTKWLRNSTRFFLRFRLAKRTEKRTILTPKSEENCAISSHFALSCLVLSCLVLSCLVFLVLGAKMAGLCFAPRR